MKPITATAVSRDEVGHWMHPDIPDFDGELDGGRPAWDAWKAEQNIEVVLLSLESDNEELATRYYENEEVDIRAWQPTPPAGDGWFLLSIADTEDGPLAWFARRFS